MKKSNILLGTIFSIFLVSCGSSIESDAEKVAKLICEVQNDMSKSAEAQEKTEKISAKYEGEEKEKFEMLVMQKAKDCLPGGSSISTESSSSDSYDDYEEHSSNEEISFSNDGSEDIDAMLDSYEDYMNEYISYMKKMNNDDISALADLPALNAKGQDWANKMEKAKGNMTARQMARMNEIINKLNIAISEMN